MSKNDERELHPVFNLTQRNGNVWANGRSSPRFISRRNGGKWISSDYGSLNPVHYIGRPVWIGESVGGRDGLAAACDGIASRRICSAGLSWSVYS